MHTQSAPTQKNEKNVRTGSITQKILNNLKTASKKQTNKSTCTTETHLYEQEKKQFDTQHHLFLRWVCPTQLHKIYTQEERTTTGKTFQYRQKRSVTVELWAGLKQMRWLKMRFPHYSHSLCLCSVWFVFVQSAQGFSALCAAHAFLFITTLLY